VNPRKQWKLGRARIVRYLETSANVFDGSADVLAAAQILDWHRNVHGFENRFRSSDGNGNRTPGIE
jgi:hypothetical protein